jgi:hypothetical protein
VTRTRAPRRAVALVTAALSSCALAVAVGPVGATQAQAASVVAPAVVAPTTVVGAVNRNSRTSVLSAYKNRYVAALKVANAWTGSVSGCVMGANSAAYTRATLQAINWARGQSGMPPVVGTASTYSSRAQAASLIMHAQDALSHSPTTSWSCWSSTGSAGASHSLLALGVAGARSIGTYLAEPGANTPVGHRRWLLYPRLGRIGIGNTSRAGAVYVITPLVALPAGAPAYYAWPTSGYFPRAAEPRGLWSLSCSRRCSFASARVRVVGPNGKAVAVTRYAPVSGYGDPTLAFRLATIPSHTATADARYRVTVTGIRTAGGTLTSYTWTTTLAS